MFCLLYLMETNVPIKKDVDIFSSFDFYSTFLFNVQPFLSKYSNFYSMNVCIQTIPPQELGHGISENTKDSKNTKQVEEHKQ